MKKFRGFISRIRLQLRGQNQVVGWKMSPAQARRFFSAQGKTMLTLLGFSGPYESEAALLATVREILLGYSPETTLVNIGGTEGGIGAAYLVAKSLHFTTSGIVSTRALSDGAAISESVDYVCFIEDEQWGGRLPNSNELSPTSQAMVECSHLMIGIGGGEISRDEMLAARGQGKPVQFYPAEASHEEAIRRAEKIGVPKPESFWGEAHEVFGGKAFMTGKVQIRAVQESDLPIFFEQQRDPLANRMAAFPARDQETFRAHWAKIMKDNGIILRTILFEGQVAGNLVSFVLSHEREVGYWLGQEFWGKGIATLALAEFLRQIEERPLYARVAKHNIASFRVLEKCGFKLQGEEKNFSVIEGEPVEGLILRLDH